MKIKDTKIPGAYVITHESVIDERGAFSRMFCKRELEEAGLCADLAQINFSANHNKGTLRGLHMQKGDAAEDKIVTCILGSVFDVCVDMREDSPTFGAWMGETLASGTALYIPKGCAHGFVTLQDDCNLLYFMTEFYRPGHVAGFRYDDPFFSIDWPTEGPYIISDQDLKWELLRVV